jgi:hypothetical protein
LSGSNIVLYPQGTRGYSTVKGSTLKKKVLPGLICIIEALDIHKVPANSVSPLYNQCVNNIERNNQINEEVDNGSNNKLRLGKPQHFKNNVNECLTWKCKVKETTVVFKISEKKSSLEAEEIQNFACMQLLRYQLQKEDLVLGRWISNS